MLAPLYAFGYGRRRAPGPTRTPPNTALMFEPYNCYEAGAPRTLNGAQLPFRVLRELLGLYSVIFFL